MPQLQKKSSARRGCHWKNRQSGNRTRTDTKHSKTWEPLQATCGGPTLPPPSGGAYGQPRAPCGGLTLAAAQRRRVRRTQGPLWRADARRHPSTARTANLRPLAVGRRSPPPSEGAYGVSRAPCGGQRRRARRTQGPLWRADARHRPATVV